MHHENESLHYNDDDDVDDDIIRLGIKVQMAVIKAAVAVDSKIKKF